MIGASIGLHNGAEYDRLKDKIEKLYSELSKSDSKNSLLNLIEIKTETYFVGNPTIRIKVTEELENKYPFTEQEKQDITYYIHKDIDLLRKYASDLETALYK